MDAAVRQSVMADKPLMGERLKAARKKKKMTAEQLADRLGVTKAAVSAWENDRAYPGVDNLMGICEYLEVSADHLLWGTEAQRIPDATLDLVRKLSGLDKDSLELLRRIFGK